MGNETILRPIGCKPPREREARDYFLHNEEAFNGKPLRLKEGEERKAELRWVKRKRGKKHRQHVFRLFLFKVHSI